RKREGRGDARLRPEPQDLVVDELAGDRFGGRILAGEEGTASRREAQRRTELRLRLLVLDARVADVDDTEIDRAERGQALEGEPGGEADEMADGSQRPIARESAATSATTSGSRPKRCAKRVTSDRGVPTPSRTSTPGSRTASASAIVRPTGSSAKRARRGA